MATTLLTDVTHKDKKKAGATLLFGRKWLELSKGLNIQAICRNKDCKVFGRKVVTRKGMTTFKPIEDTHEVNCPICNQNCAEDEIKFTFVFTECKYKMKGTYKIDHKSGPMPLNDDWIVVEKGKFHKYTPEDCGEVKWIKLAIEAVDLD